MASRGSTGGPGGLGRDRGLGGAGGPTVATRFWASRPAPGLWPWPDGWSVVVAVTSLGWARRHGWLFHQVSRAATSRASSSPAARMQKTPAKLCSRRARPSGWASAWLSRSQRPLRGHHFCFRMSRSPFSWSSRILRRRGRTSGHHVREYATNMVG